MLKAEEIPTNEQIQEEIDSCRRYIQWLEGLQKLNEKGKEVAIVYLIGLSQLKKYKKEDI